jgi:hypothetical protein
MIALERMWSLQCYLGEGMAGLAHCTARQGTEWALYLCGGAGECFGQRAFEAKDQHLSAERALT